MNNNTCVPVVIVNFNAGERLRDCVMSVLQSDCDVRVYVSDNGSTDNSLNTLETAAQSDPRLIVVRNDANLGFAKGNNRILPMLPQSEFILFLNPDCLLQSDTISRISQILAAYPNAGLASCLIVNPDGSEQRGCRRQLPTPWQSMVQALQLQRIFPNSPRFRSFNLTGSPLPAQPMVVEATSGAFMLVRTRAMAEVGPLDEGYFLHCEDIDWCARFTQAGYQVLFIPQVKIIHYQGSCSHQRPIRVEWHKHRGMLRFYRKFFAQRYSQPIMWLMYLLVGSRFILLCLLFAGRRLVNIGRRD